MIRPLQSGLALPKISISNCGSATKSTNGKVGVGGPGGRGGRQGNTMQYVMNFETDTGDLILSMPSETYASYGARGTDGTNKYGMQNAFDPRPALNKVTAVDNFKIHLRASLNESGRHKNTRHINTLFEHFSNL